MDRTVSPKLAGGVYDDADGLADVAEGAPPRGSSSVMRDRSRRDPNVVSVAMQRVKGRDTSVEMAFRQMLHARGLRYRLHDIRLPGKPDLVLPRSRLVVFIDGDFWHGNQPYLRGHRSLGEQFARVHGREYWVPKITRTMERDRRNTAALVASGWRVLRFWESDVTTNLADCVEITVQAARGAPVPTARPTLAERSFAEFFAGIGLVRLGLEMAGWTARFANDIDERKREMYAANFYRDPPGTYVVKDVHDLRPSDVPTVTLATASFPCTDVSLAGERNGLAGSESGTLFPFLHILRDMGDRRPPLVLLENVVGLLTSHRGNDFRRVLQDLNSLGYAVDAFIVDALNFVPQSRPRLFIVGVRDDSDGGIPPSALVETTVRPRSLIQRMAKEMEIRWRVLPLPDPPNARVGLSDVLEQLPDDAPEWWSDERATYLLEQMSERHSRLAAEMIASPVTRVGTVYRRVRYGRSMAELRTDDVSGCLRTPRGGSSRQILFEAGKGQYRARFMTPREYARLQGVPDSYPITVRTNQALFGFGDAVCVPVISWIAEHYLNVIVSQLIRGRLIVA
jgi:DNA (cytosine-5)-methyltransferase 1